MQRVVEVFIQVPEATLVNVRQDLCRACKWSWLHEAPAPVHLCDTGSLGLGPAPFPETHARSTLTVVLEMWIAASSCSPERYGQRSTRTKAPPSAPNQHNQDTAERHCVNYTEIVFFAHCNHPALQHSLVAV
jgi:hypothetical protein